MPEKTPLDRKYPLKHPMRFRVRRVTWWPSVGKMRKENWRRADA
jgi:hypothetical protein